MSRRIGAVYTAQKRIPATDPPIPVESAFGGMALYRVSAIGTCRHSAPGDDCEHVAFHQCLRDHDGRLFIHPGVVVVYEKYCAHHCGEAPDDLAPDPGLESYVPFSQGGGPAAP